MKLPNKIISYEESSLSKYASVLSVVNQGPIKVLDLYRKLGAIFSSIDEFIEVLDGLYALRAIEYDKKEEALVYVKNDSF